MSETKSRLPRYLATAAIYLIVVASAFGFNIIRSRAARSTVEASPPTEPSIVSTKPYFSLTTNRTYSPNETARMWASYQNVDYLDFRVYRVKDPSKFFKQLDDPHQMGEKEKEAVSQGYGSRVSILERTHRLKISLFSAVRDYVRTHLLKEHRETFNQKFRKSNEPTQTPLNVATDYATVPLLNPDQKVKDWREKLPPLENDYDSRMVSLGKQQPGVYLVEAVNGDLRAYSIAIVTNLTMIEKTTKDGQVVVYVVDRKTGAPHQGVNIEVTRAKETLATGTTDKAGVFKTEIKSAPATTETPAEDVDPEAQTKNAYLIMARRARQLCHLGCRIVLLRRRGRRGRRPHWRGSHQLHLHRSAHLSPGPESLFQRHPAPMGAQRIRTARQQDRQRHGRGSQQRQSLREGIAALKPRHLQRRAGHRR